MLSSQEREKRLKREREMGRDDSFRKPGAIPFKWEIRPGVPKHLQHQPHQNLINDDNNRSYSLPTTPHTRKLTPPPFCFTPPPDVLTPSFHSASWVRSHRNRVNPPLLTRRPNSVSIGCFLSPWFRRKRGKKRSVFKPKLEPQPDPDYSSELETIARWSMSTRKSLSPLWDSLSSSPFSSQRSSPQIIGDAEWAAFGLF